MKFIWDDVPAETWELLHVGLIVKDLEKTLAFYHSLDLITSVAVGVDGELERHSYEDFGEPREKDAYPGQKIGMVRLGGLPVTVKWTPLLGPLSAVVKRIPSDPLRDKIWH